MNELKFESKESIMQHLRHHYQELGVFLSIKTSKPNRFVFKCDRGGKQSLKYSESIEIRKIKSKSRLCGCPFEIVCSSIKGIWSVRKLTDIHNHEISKNKLDHPISRRLTQAQKDRIAALRENGIAPKDILLCINNEFEGHFVMAQVYNELQKQRVKQQKSMDALIETDDCPESPRKQILSKIEALLYDENVQKDSFMARLRYIIETPDSEEHDLLPVTKIPDKK